jgi:hypothetical protein
VQLTFDDVGRRKRGCRVEARENAEGISRSEELERVESLTRVIVRVEQAYESGDIRIFRIESSEARGPLGGLEIDELVEEKPDAGRRAVLSERHCAIDSVSKRIASHARA